MCRATIKVFDFNYIDFIFIDSDHSKSFTRKYIKEVLKPAESLYKSKQQIVQVFIHDIFGRFKSSRDEGSLVREFIKDREYFTPSILKENRKDINNIRDKLGLSKTIIHAASNVNPVVIFNLG